MGLDRDALTQRLIRTAAFSVAAFALVYGAFVLTARGQVWDDVMMLLPSERTGHDFAQRQLGNITVVTLGGLLLLLGAIGVLRRRTDLALAATGTVVVSVLLAEGFKAVLPRPDLVELSAKLTGNSFPSGHTTIAMSVMFGLILVVPYRARLWAGLFGLVWAVGVGAYTVIADWHRPSDTFGGDLIALAVGCGFAAALVLRGRATAAPGPHWGRILPVALPLAAIAVWGVLSGAGPGLAGAASALTALVFLALLHRVDLSTPDEYFDSSQDHPGKRTITA